jgi:hypothetical protein
LLPFGYGDRVRDGAGLTNDGHTGTPIQQGPQALPYNFVIIDQHYPQVSVSHPALRLSSS